jgi:transposase
MGRRNLAIELTAEDRAQLEAIQRTRALPHSLVRRARIVLLSADGVPAGEIARLCHVSGPTVSLWRRRFLDEGLSGLHDEIRSGRPRRLADEEVAELINTVLQTTLPGATYWSVR